ncbi:MAG: YlxR family protein [Ilumatobacter sp.]|uniref:YlxR family protein n=1 Tax=Ilumatobacter sp. TaxID=1967498 RepID=UPI0039193654
MAATTVPLSPRCGSTPRSRRKRRAIRRLVPAIDRHHPVRSCIGCRQRRPASELVRITRSADGIVVDGPSSGRGAWLCRAVDGSGDAELATIESSCLDEAIRRSQFARAWRTTIGRDELDAIRTTNNTR